MLYSPFIMLRKAGVMITKEFMKTILPIVLIVFGFAGVAFSFGYYVDEIKTKTATSDVTFVEYVSSDNLADAEPAAGEGEEEHDLFKVRGVGDPNAPVIVKEFSSYTCSHCATFHNNALDQIKENYIDTGKIYFEFHDFPLNAPALEASMLSRCVPESRHYKFMNLLFETQTRWAAAGYQNALKQMAKLAGLNNEQYKACLANEDLKQSIVQSMQGATETYNIQSTPSFVINDGEEILVGAQSYEAFQKVFDKILAEQKSE